MSCIFKQFQELNIDKSSIGLIPCETNYDYFCTPVGAILIGALGVDGIHFCFIPRLQKDVALENGRVYAVNPMGVDEYVYPVANNFIEFLSLVTTCCNASSLELVRYTSLTNFNEVLNEDDEVKGKVEALAILQSEFDLMTIANPYEFIKEIQQQFDSKVIPYSDEYYEVTGSDKTIE